MTNYEKCKFLKEKLNAPKFDDEDEEIEWYAKHLYGLYHQASRLREENNHYMSKIDKQKEILNKVKEHIKENTEYIHDGDEYGYMEYYNIKGDTTYFINYILELLEKIE